METFPDSKKAKFDSETYDKYSKEDLIQIIRKLKCPTPDRQISECDSFEASTSPPITQKRKNKANRKFDFSKCKFRHIALKILYLGWDFGGFVEQEDKYNSNSNNTIEKHLFAALLKACLIEDRSKSMYHRCGRTDKGVSSFSQVVSITVRSRLNESDNDDKELPYCTILNALLPEEIRVIAWAPVSNEFSARFNCKKRVYKYWFPLGNLDIEKMKKSIQNLIGLHDFRNLCKMDVEHGVVNFERRIFDADVSLYRGKLVPHNPISNPYSMCELTIIGEGFLWHQIRAIVTVLFLVGQGKENADITSKLLNVTECPKKPIFGLSHPLPLNLYDCEYDGIAWKSNDHIFKQLKKTLQSFWTISAVKCAMLSSMLGDLPKVSQNEGDQYDPVYAVLFKDFPSKVYTPLLSRPTEKSLDERISFYLKKGTWKFRDTYHKKLKP